MRHHGRGFCTLVNDGAFAASQDADTDGEEGATFVWTTGEVREVLGPGSPLFEAGYGVTEAGNWEGRTILSRVATDGELAARFELAEDEVRRRLTASRRSMLARRASRPQPARDDKALAAWNGLAIAAFADRQREMAAAKADFDKLMQAVDQFNRANAGKLTISDKLRSGT